MKFRIIILAWIVSAAMCGIATEVRALEVSAVGAYNMMNHQVTPALDGVTYKPGAAIGGGLLLGFRIGVTMNFEIGAIYLPSQVKYDFSSGGEAGSGKMEWTAAVVPMLLRITPTPALSFGAGAYYAHTLGNLKRTTDYTAPTATSESTSEVPNPQGEFGVAGSLQLRLRLKPKLSFIIDGRYHLGLTDLDDNPSSSVKHNAITGLAGFLFSL